MFGVIGPNPDRFAIVDGISGTLVAVYGSAISLSYPRRVRLRRIMFNCIDHEDFKTHIPLTLQATGNMWEPSKNPESS